MSELENMEFPDRELEAALLAGKLGIGKIMLIEVRRGRDSELYNFQHGVNRFRHFSVKMDMLNWLTSSMPDSYEAKRMHKTEKNKGRIISHHKHNSTTNHRSNDKSHGGV